MTSVRIKWLVACAALGLGEYVASLAPEFAGLWPTAALLLVLVVLFGYGFRLSCWPAAACFLLGIALFLQASVQSEENYRLRPWMRGRRTHVVSRQSDLSLRVKRDLARRLSLGLEHDREAAALNRAILLGDRAALPQKTKRMFVDSGALHVFAVSGLHVMSVVQAFCLFAAFLFVPRRFIGLAVLPLVWGYVWAIGWPPSAVRAVLMASFFLIAPLFWRRADGIMAWALTYLIVHVARPLMVSNVGNALSFAVTVPSVTISKRPANLRRWASNSTLTSMPRPAATTVPRRPFPFTVRFVAPKSCRNGISGRSVKPSRPFFDALNRIARSLSG